MIEISLLKIEKYKIMYVIKIHTAKMSMDLNFRRRKEQLMNFSRNPATTTVIPRLVK